METKENIKEFDLITPSQKLLDAVIVSTDAYSPKPMDEIRSKNMKLALGYLNAYIRAFGTKVGYFRLTGISDKVKVVEKFSKKFKK